MKKTSFGLQSIDQKLNDLLKPIFSGNKKEFILINNLSKNWSEIVGRKYEKLCYPQSVKFDKNEKTANLTIAVHNPAIGFFLENNSEVIVERIAILFGFKSIKKIIIKQDPKIIGKSAEKEVKLTTDKQKILDENIKNIDDEKLLEALKNLGKDILKNN